MKLEPSLKRFLLLLFVTLIGIIILNSGKEKEVICMDAPILEAPNISYFPKNKTLADVVEDVNGDVDIELYDLAYRIIECESSWSYTAKNKHSSAYGLGQFLDGTWIYIQNKWGMDLDRYNKEDQLYAMVRLLEEESWVHWSESKSCWDKDNEY